jgi:hypothetical protein
VRLLTAQYQYDRETDEAGHLLHRLRETRYRIDCPNCGPREQVVRHE